MDRSASDVTDYGLSYLENPHDPAMSPLVEELSDDDLRAMYRDLVLGRRLDIEATALQRHGELGMWVPLFGQEAAQVGTAWGLREQDHLFPSYRDHAAALCHGIPPATLLAMFRGVNHGGWDPERYRFHLYTIVVGAQTLHATGYAMGIQRDGLVGNGDLARDTAVATFMGDGATSQGDVSESFVFAAVTGAPCVFVCQNNQWAISESNDKQIRGTLPERARGFGIPGMRVDGNDVLAMYAQARLALDSARAGAGPQFIEAYTYRLGPHTTSDDPRRYRSTAEEESWRERDPISRFRTFLEDCSVASQTFFDDLEEESDRFGADVRRACLDLPDPQPTDMWRHTYAEGHPTVDAEQGWFVRYQADLDSGEVVNV